MMNLASSQAIDTHSKFGAGEGIRTPDPNLGNAQSRNLLFNISDLRITSQNFGIWENAVLGRILLHNAVVKATFRAIGIGQILWVFPLLSVISLCVPADPANRV